VTLVPVVLILLLIVAVVAVRSPVQRRLAFRNANRRKNEAALVIAGSLLGTALITGSFIVGDTLDSSISATARTQLGPIDEILVVPDSDQAEGLERELSESGDQRIDGVLSLMGVPGSVVVDPEGDARAEPEAQIIEVDFDDARAFGDDPEATGISGDTPAPGEVALTEDLAETLSVGVGDEVSVFIYGAQEDLEVVRLVPRLGIAGFWLGLESKSSNAFVAPGTITELAGGRSPKGALPPTTSILVSNRGDVEEGAELTEQVTEVIESAVGSNASLRVEPVKKDRLDSAEEQGAEFSELFLGIGAFAIIAGVLLLINIFVMLAQERKSQLGMLRAIGLRRADLVRVFVIEGFVYSVFAGILGAILGIGVGWAIAKLAAPIFGGSDEFALELLFSMSPESIVLGFCLGMIITSLTIFFTSLRISRINIIRAIRDLPEPTGRATRKRALVAGGLLALVSLTLFVSSLGETEGWPILILGPAFAAFGLLPLLSRALDRRTAVLLVAGFSLLWGIFGNAILGNEFFENGDIFAFVLQGILLTFSAVIILSQTTDLFERGIRRIAARNLPVRLGLAYPVARRFRTGLTLGMYALVIFTMTFIAVLSNIFGGQVEDTVRRASGGFDILVTASGTNPPSEADLEEQAGIDDAAALLTGNALFQPPDVPTPEPWPATGIDDDFVAIGPPELEERDEGYENDAAVWDAVLSDPELVVIPDFFLQEGGGPPEGVLEVGETMEMVDPLTGESSERKVAGILSQDAAFSGVYMSQESIGSVLGPQATPSRFFVVAEEDQPAATTAQELQGELFRNGVEADTFKGIVEEFQALNLQFFRLMQGYLALGLLVGIAGLGVVMVRAVRERRREIGVLRSLGFLAPSVRRAFLFESTFIALQGILTGAILALITAAQLVATEAFGETAVFSIPWDDLLWLCAAALIASLLATAWPAHQASQVPPAVALRVAE
jgi:putative ABC transport system permease protein